MSDAKDAPKETKVSQLSPNRLMLSEHALQVFVANPEAGTPPEATLDSKYWAHYSVNPNMQIKPGNIIMVMPEDGTYFQELLAREVYRGGVKVVELRRVMLDKQVMASEDAGDYEVRWSGPRLKWRVIRKADKREMVSGLENRDAAFEWLKQHHKALAA